MNQEEIRNMPIKSYELSLLLPFNVNPIVILDDHTAIVNSKTKRFRCLHRFLEKQKKIGFNEYDKMMNLLSNIENCNGKIVSIATKAISSKVKNDSIFIRITFHSHEDLEKFDSLV